MSAVLPPPPAALPTFLPPSGTPFQAVGTDASGGWLIFENALCHNGQWYNIVIQKFDLASRQVIPFDSRTHQLPIDAPAIVQTSVELILRSIANSNIVHPLTPDRVGLIYATDGDSRNDQFKLIEADSAFQTIGQASHRGEFDTLIDRSVEPKRNSWNGEEVQLAPQDRGRFDPDVSVSDMHAISRMRRIWEAVSPGRALHTAGTLALSAMPNVLPYLHIPRTNLYTDPGAGDLYPSLAPLYAALDQVSGDYARANGGSYLAGVRWSDLRLARTGAPVVTDGHARARAALAKLAANARDSNPDCVEMRNWLALHNRRARQFYFNAEGDVHFDAYKRRERPVLSGVTRYQRPLLDRENYARHHAAYTVVQELGLFVGAEALVDALKNL